MAFAISIGSLVVGILKVTNAHACPWDLVEYGGHALAYPLLDSAPIGNMIGRCFPGGHASSGFGLMALFFLFYPRSQRLALVCWLAAVALGLLMGFGQVMRGAHFITHNLWSGWWVWLSQLLLFWLAGRFIPYRGKSDDGTP